ncbi:MAG: alkaline phosphatase family protein [Verrucomicrobia bacterium]|nr:alkaline phosphatase family protein [Verrucomicrobiota bacterium]
MKAVLPLFVFIDACGWEIIKNNSFARACAPNRKRMASVFGYSSACIPSIVSGNWPVDHRNWCYFVYDPKNSPFRSLRPLRWLPTAITSRRRFRRWLSKFVKSHLKFRGYFDLYNIPFQHISLFDFTEKKNPLAAGGMNRGPNIFDFLKLRDIPFHVSDPARTEQENLGALQREIADERIDFAFLYWPDLDGLMHLAGNDSPEVERKLREYEEGLGRLLAVAERHYAEVRLYVFSDHGMADCEELLDLRAKIQALGLKMPEDYAVVYDSTMARFWFFNGRARERISGCLQRIPQGRIVPDEELEQMGTLFPDRAFGELIFLVEEGVLIVPSFMGERPIRAMHGYHPSARQSFAALLTNQLEIPEDVVAIPHLFQLMVRDAEQAQTKNAQPSRKEKLPETRPSRTQETVPLVVEGYIP